MANMPRLGKKALIRATEIVREQANSSPTHGPTERTSGDASMRGKSDPRRERRQDDRR